MAKNRRRSGRVLKLSEQIKSNRMRNVFSQSYDRNYAKANSDKQIDKDIAYLRNTLYRSKKAFEKRGLGEETGNYFDTALKSIRTSKNMSKQEKTEMLNAAVGYSREHRLTVSLFDLQKQMTMEALNSDEFSSIVRQSKEMSGKDEIQLGDLSDAQMYKVFEALRDIRKGLGKYEKVVGVGSGDEFDAAIEVVYASTNPNADWVYNTGKSLTDNILDYLRTAKKKVAEKVF